MSEMEEKLASVLNNPQLMQQIMSMAQSLNTNQPKETPPNASGNDPVPGFDSTLLKQLSGFSQQNNVDQNQQALLKALSPYLSRDRVGKLERAMRAARMAGMASSFFQAGGLQMLTGR